MIFENPIVVNELSSELLNKAADKRTKQLSKLYKKNTPWNQERSKKHFLNLQE